MDKPKLAEMQADVKKHLSNLKRLIVSIAIAS